MPQPNGRRPTRDEGGGDMDDIRAAWLRGLPEAGEIARLTDTLTVTAKYRGPEEHDGRQWLIFDDGRGVTFKAWADTSGLIVADGLTLEPGDVYRLKWGMYRDGAEIRQRVTITAAIAAEGRPEHGY